MHISIARAAGSTRRGSAIRIVLPLLPRHRPALLAPAPSSSWTPAATAVFAAASARREQSSRCHRCLLLPGLRRLPPPPPPCTGLPVAPAFTAARLPPSALPPTSTVGCAASPNPPSKPAAHWEPDNPRPQTRLRR
ncbi:hypothetical protein PVAP13_5KG251221 [Panicum virgatum]|uniref:Uncharacterized protein n=1 Tax=Panicum virgatum TaxID=38727 RepID=A0A8T0SL68_PANVG|nr:hypothetical protein PVAP13_5KG251221 [Panicum virgatum]